ncbi:hypothetical protein N431DRAFT_513969 [Stipitochalara longipes BDJ]|nr:hypothetical protein N431DRAFT_513969 [Stipitochalara longipes BDJ]
MPIQKRKANEYVCECFEAHETKDECENHSFLDEREGLVAKHRAITGQIILYSETVEVFVGKEQKQTFVVHKDLLALHSTYFSNLLSDNGLDENMKINVFAKPSLFADFVSWIYFGEFLKVKNDALEGAAAVDDLWELGRFFKAPAFQNFCMDDCRTYCKASETDPNSPWPFVTGIKQMYSITPKGSRLRKLAVDSDIQEPLAYEQERQYSLEGVEGIAHWAELHRGVDQ